MMSKFVEKDIIVMKKIKMFFSFRYTRFIVAIILICLISLMVYWTTYNPENMIIPNIFGNIFAGLIASIVITIYSNVRTEELGEIATLIQKLNNTNALIYKYFKDHETKKKIITREMVENAYNEYCNLRSVLDKLRIEYDSFSFKESPKPALGDTDDCVEVCMEKISLGLHENKDNEYEEYLEFMVSSSTVMMHQNTYVINYLLMYLNFSNKFAI